MIVVVYYVINMIAYALLQHLGQCPPNGRYLINTCLMKRKKQLLPTLGITHVVHFCRSDGLTAGPLQFYFASFSINETILFIYIQSLEFLFAYFNPFVCFSKRIIDFFLVDLQGDIYICIYYKYKYYQSLFSFRHCKYLIPVVTCL